jgi:hypothetical protein
MKPPLLYVCIGHALITSTPLLILVTASCSYDGDVYPTSGWLAITARMALAPAAPLPSWCVRTEKTYRDDLPSAVYFLQI